MNARQRLVMFATIICMVIAFVYAPHAILAQGSAYQMGYALIFNLPHAHSVYVPMLLAEWFGILVVGGMLFYLLKDGDEETSYSEERPTEGATPSTASTGKHLVAEGYTPPVSTLSAFGSNGNDVTPATCPKCGYARTENDDAPAWQCPACGVAYNKIRLQPPKVAPARLISGGPRGALMGTKWLMFWSYFSLPVGGILGLLVSLVVPKIWVIMIPVAILQFVVAYGLHNRKIWAWQWNWGVIILTWFSGAIPRSFSSSADLWVQFIILVPVFGLIWVWPNYVYWMKRKALFS